MIRIKGAKKNRMKLTEKGENVEVPSRGVGARNDEFRDREDNDNELGSNLFKYENFKMEKTVYECANKNTQHYYNSSAKYEICCYREFLLLSQLALMLSRGSGKR